jgi:hypothetical protein
MSILKDHMKRSAERKANPRPFEEVKAELRQQYEARKAAEAAKAKARPLIHEIAKPSYNYCKICGSVPGSKLTDPPNYAPLRFWDCDDGWKIGTLCTYCFNDVRDDKPHPDDYASQFTNHVCDDADTDEDPTEALFF